MKLFEILKTELTPDQVMEACRNYLLAKRPDIGNRAIKTTSNIPGISFEIIGGEWTPAPELAPAPVAAVVEAVAAMDTFIKSRKDAPLLSVERGHLVIDKKSQIQVGKVLVKRFTRCDLKNLKQGSDYGVFLDSSGHIHLIIRDKISNAPKTLRQIGGFHFDLGGKVLPNSIWDLKFKPTVDLPGLKLVQGKKGKFWDYIYFMGQDTFSRAGVIPADGGSYPPTGYKNLSWNTLNEIAAKLGMQLLSRQDFADSMAGAKEGAVTKGKPKLTERLVELLSSTGSEQAFGSLWCLLSETHESLGEPWKYIAGGSYDFAGDSGPRYLDNYHADYSYGIVGARLRCDHLELD